MSNPNDRSSHLLEPPVDNPAEVTAAFKVLAGAVKEDVPRLPENLFIERILPLLTAPPGTKVDLTAWLDIAGTPLRAIDVADNITGEILFRVPSLMRTLPTVQQDEVNYGNIIAETEARTRTHPLMGERYLQQELSKARTGATLLDVETAKQMNAIRVRYGHAPLPVFDEDGRPIETTQKGINGSDGKLVLSDDDDDVPLF